MDKVKIVVLIIIFCGFIMNFISVKSFAFDIECITVFAVCIYAISAASSGIDSFDFDKYGAYSKLESYREYVVSSQKKLFDDIATLENGYEKD